MHVEVIGCTSAGKSTLARGLALVCRQRGIDAMTGDELVLRQVRLDWVRSEFLRRRIVDVPALFTCVLTWRRHGPLLRFALAVSRRSPGSWTRRLNLARNALRKVGLYEIVRRRRRAGQLVVVDNEGVLQAAHNLFVHVAAEADARDLQTFLHLAPLPDAVLYVKETVAVLVERTLARGHKRVPAGEPVGARRFVEQATRVFEALVRDPAVRGRLLIVSGDGTVGIGEPPDAAAPRLGELAELIRSVVDARRSGRWPVGARRDPVPHSA